MPATGTRLAAAVLVALATAAHAQQYSGSATYSNINAGVCSGGTNGLPAVSMNAAQFGGGDACGKCVQIQGTGNGAGQSPVSTTSYIAIVNNVCPQCAYGDIDLQTKGDGKFGITWSFTACPNAGRKLIEELPEAEQQTPESQEAAAAPTEASMDGAPLDAGELEQAPSAEATTVEEAAQSQGEAADESSAGADATGPRQPTLVASRRLLQRI